MASKSPLVITRPQSKWKLVVVMGVMLAMGFVGGYYSVPVPPTDEEQLNINIELEKENIALVQQITQLQQQLVNVDTGRAVQRQSMSDLRANNNQLQDQIYALEKELTFYQRIVAPENERSGVQLHRLSLTPTLDEQRFRYHLVLIQAGNRHEQQQGQVRLTVVGDIDGERSRLALSDIVVEGDVPSQFKFRYFQDFNGELVLPVGFIPERIEAVVAAQGGQEQQESFAWMIDLEQGGGM